LAKTRSKLEDLEKRVVEMEQQVLNKEEVFPPSKEEPIDD
jgi:BMFP domain-containing protein YqiC